MNEGLRTSKNPRLGLQVETIRAGLREDCPESYEALTALWDLVLNAEGVRLDLLRKVRHATTALVSATEDRCFE